MPLWVPSVMLLGPASIRGSRYDWKASMQAPIKQARATQASTSKSKVGTSETQRRKQQSMHQFKASQHHGKANKQARTQARAPVQADTKRGQHKCMVCDCTVCDIWEDLMLEEMSTKRGEHSCTGTPPLRKHRLV